MKKILVVGSWAKEQITLENISRRPGREVYSYLDTVNPGILNCAKGCRIAPLNDIESIADYAASLPADLVLITTAEPLARGAADAIEAAGISVFAPGRSAARLETDKAFTRKFMQKVVPEALPGFGVFEKPEEARDFAEYLNWEVAVKPAGLTEGLGVRVYGDQLKNGKEVADYIKQLLENGRDRIVVEEKMEGVEFTLQCIVNGDILIPTPLVRDFKKLLADGRGPNTASMGSYSTRKRLPPFMDRSDYDAALSIIQRTVEAFTPQVDGKCKGFLYGQFMITESGLKLIEYNFRPGDPEWMNTISLLENDLVEAVEEVMAGGRPALSFRDTCSICKYIVPPEYPYRLNQPLRIEFEPEKIAEKGVGLYYSCGLDERGVLNVGTERGVALIANGKRLRDANQKIEEAVSMIDGKFHYRSDIGNERDLPEITSG